MNKKKAHGIQLLIRAVVRDPDGNVISDTGRKPARSFVIAFLAFVGGMLDGADGSETAVTGAEELIYDVSADTLNVLNIVAGINDASFGIWVGTGDTAEDNIDHKLDVKLSEGVGAGSITHNATVIYATAVVGANVDLEIKRSFTNNTGSTITVKEAGLVCDAIYAPQPNHLLIRDVLPAPVDVPDNCSLSIHYTLRTTV